VYIAAPSGHLVQQCILCCHGNNRLVTHCVCMHASSEWYVTVSPSH